MKLCQSKPYVDQQAQVRGWRLTKVIEMMARKRMSRVSV